MTEFASVCVLSYERPAFLDTALRLLVERAEYPLQLIIHDDGSGGMRVREVLDGWRGLATIILNPVGHNQGQGVALNRMFRMAEGDPIIKFDQDLEPTEGWLRNTVELLERNRRADLVADRRAVMGETVEVEPLIGLLGLCHYHHDPVDMRKDKIADWDGWSEHPLILGSAFALRRSAWEELGPFDEYSDAFNEDGAMQRAVTASDVFVCGLPHTELVANHHMGPPDSTVVYYKPDMSVGVHTIHHQPLILGGT